jgi:thioredoxin-like negative regulator of GroEL
MAPEWQKFFEQSREEVHVGSVNCKAQKKLCKQFGVDKYPRLVYFPSQE